MEFTTNNDFVQISNIDEYVQRFNRDCKNNNLDSLLQYIYDPLFISTISNNSETIEKSFIYLTAITMSLEMKEDIFRRIYASILPCKRWRILGGEFVTFEDFFDKYKNKKHVFVEKILSNKEREMQEIKFILDTLLNDMLTSESLNYKNIRHYCDCEEGDIETYYNTTIDLIIKYRHRISFEKLIKKMIKYEKYLYFFMDNEEYPKYFKRIFDLYDMSNLKEIVKSLHPLIYYILYDIDYEKFSSRYSLVLRLILEYRSKKENITSNDDLFNEQKSLIFEKKLLMSKWQGIIFFGSVTDVKTEKVITKLFRITEILS